MMIPRQREAAGRVSAALLMLFFLLPLSVRAQEKAELAGRISDAETGEPVASVQLYLPEIGFSEMADEDGRFVITSLPAGNYRLETYRLGYERTSRPVTLRAGERTTIEIELDPVLLESEEVIVEGRREEVVGDQDVALDDRALRRELGATVAETMSEEPGVAMRSMGPASARPVLRGLGGARLLVLEDGGRTGDLSHTSTDHALAVDPMTAQGMSVLRGPAALAYGSNALGGVIDVNRGYVPERLPPSLTGRISTQVNSVNRGLSASGDVSVPVGRIALRADGSVRNAGDLQTPVGVLENTQVQTLNGSVGASYVRGETHAGLSAAIYDSRYGIPGGFVGAHPNGVDIEMQRRRVSAEAGASTGLAAAPHVDFEFDHTWYFHQEFESSGSVGSEFGLLSYHGRAQLTTAEVGPFESGFAGVWGEWRDYASGGFTFTPASTEGTLAAYIFQKARLGALTLSGSFRIDARTVTPSVEEENDIGRVRERSFRGWSGGLSASYALTPEWESGVRLLRSLRMPGIEELYSQGPHLAAYTFEVGNPSLGAEQGAGVELFSRFEESGWTADAAVYYNRIDDFIFPRNTGRLDRRQLLPVYQYSGAEVQMWGAEAALSVPLGYGLSAAASASYVRGALVETDRALPEIPPLKGRLSLDYRAGAWHLGSALRWAASQERVYTYETPQYERGERIRAEDPTAGYAVFDASAEYHFDAVGMHHTLTLSAENLLDATYRDHLARVRTIMPEPGRSIRLLYRAYF